jgi:hypothetical protein
MADIRISQLPVAPAPIDGTELVPVVQNGLTVQTTVSAITQSPSLTATFLTVNQQPLLPNSRALSAGVGIGITDGGAQSTYNLSLNGTSGSLETVSTGVIVKSAANTISARTLTASGNGISITDGNGVSGNPTFQLTGLAAAIANMSGTGLIGLNSTTLTPLTIIGVTNEISVADGNGAGGNPTIGIADNAVLPGVAGVTLPNGTTAERGASLGQIRYNTTSSRFEGNYGTGWQNFGTGDGAIASVAGTTNQIVVSTAGGAATVSIDPDPVIPGVGAIQIPAGTTVQRPGGANGQLRYNSTTATFEGYANGSWGSIVTGSGVTSVGTGTGLTGGPITSTGTISIADTGAVASTYGNSARTVTQAVNAQGQITSIFDQPIDGIALTTGSISAAPSTGNSLVNKTYVDGLVATGLVYHQPVQASTTATLASITGGTVTYNNGAAGVGATLTLSVALTTLDGYTLLNTNRILVKDEANQAHNGVYTWATGGTVLTRATDADTYGTAPNQLSQNDYFFIQNGSVNRGTSYVVSTVGTIVFGTTAITFAEFSSSLVYTAGTGLTLTGTQFSITAPVTAALGGTGQTSYATGDMLFASGATSLAKLAAGVNGYLLTMNAGIPSWQPAPATGVTSFSAGTTGLTPSTGTTGAVTLAGTLGVANGGTGLTSVTANRLPYGNGTSALQTSANLTFDGTTLTNTGNAVISDNSANAALRITQVGAGNALLVEDSANPDATPFVVTAAGDVGVGTTAPGVKLDVADGFVRLTQDYAVRWHSAGTIRGALLADSGSNMIFQTGSTSTERGRVSSSGVWSLGAAPGAESLRVTPVASAVNFIEAFGSATANRPLFRASGSDTNIGIEYQTKAAGVHLFRTDFDKTQFLIAHTASAVNYLQVTGGATGSGTTLSAQGTDANIDVNITAKGVNSTVFRSGGGAQFVVGDTASAVNYLRVSGASTTNDPTITAQGSDTNIDVQIVPKGTGGLRFAGPLLPNNLAGTSGQVLQSNGAGAVPTWVTPAGGVTLSNDTSTATNLYPTFASATSGSVSTIFTGNARLLYKPSTGELQSTVLNASNGIVVNSATVSESYTIPSGSNAISAGPVTINSGITVTVPSGSVWVIA